MKAIPLSRRLCSSYLRSRCRSWISQCTSAALLTLSAVVLPAWSETCCDVPLSMLTVSWVRMRTMILCAREMLWGLNHSVALDGQVQNGMSAQLDLASGSGNSAVTDDKPEARVASTIPKATCDAAWHADSSFRARSHNEIRGLMRLHGGS